MAKTRQMSNSGILLAVLLGATALGAKDTFITNIRNVGDVIHEVACTAQSVAGGIVNSNLLECADNPTPVEENIYGE